MKPSCFAHHARHALSNAYDWRYWLRTWTFLLLDFSLLLTSTILSASDEIPFIFSILASVFFAITALLMIPQTKTCLAVRRDLEAKFGQEQSLALPALRAIMEQYPPHTFSLDAEKLRNGEAITYTCEELALSMRVMRSGVGVIALQFIADWLSFFASLMVFSSANTNAVSVAQGVFAVLDLGAIFHRVMSQYLAKYQSKIPCCWWMLACYYWASMLGLFALLLAGFTICLSVAAALPVNIGEEELVGGIPLRNAAGFWTGWALTFCFLATFVHIAFVYFFVAACGCATYLGRKSGVQEAIEFVNRRMQGVIGNEQFNAIKMTAYVPTTLRTNKDAI